MTGLQIVRKLSLAALPHEDMKDIVTEVADWIDRIEDKIRVYRSAISAIKDISENTENSTILR